jgi:hypothetical protein
VLRSRLRAGARVIKAVDKHGLARMESARFLGRLARSGHRGTARSKSLPVSSGFALSPRKPPIVTSTRFEYVAGECFCSLGRRTNHRWGDEAQPRGRYGARRQWVTSPDASGVAGTGPEHVTVGAGGKLTPLRRLRFDPFG